MKLFGILQKQSPYRKEQLVFVNDTIVVLLEVFMTMDASLANVLWDVTIFLKNYKYTCQMC